MAWKLGAAGLYSDDFYDDTPLQSHWSEKTETGITGSFEGGGTSNARYVMDMDSANHELDSAKEHYMIYQDVSSDTDFEIEAMMDLIPDVYGAEAGIIVENSDRSNIVWLGMYVGVFATPTWRVYSAKHEVGGSPEWDYDWGDQVDIGTTKPSEPWRLRLKRTESTNTWEFWYKEFGETEVKLATTPTFDMVVDKVGIYIANFDTTPADIVKFDYFFENSANFIAIEDTVEGLLSAGRMMFR